MENKVVLILVDGMRPDGLLQCGHPFVQTMLEKFAYSLNARTVIPPVTLPCHMSLFHSVDPDRHGVTTNTYIPMARPVKGIAEVLAQNGLKNAFFLTWEELRDLSRPDSLTYSMLINQHKQADTDTKITRAAIEYIGSEKPDFTFLYLGETDEVGGHDVGWMSEQYEKCLYKAAGCIENVFNHLPEGYSMIVVADHGGHERNHGSDIPEDMTIPLFAYGEAFAPGEQWQDGASIKDVAPTVAKLLGAAPAKEWEGKPLF